MFDGVLLCVIFFILAILCLITLLSFLIVLIKYQEIHKEAIIVFVVCGSIFLGLLIANSNHYNNSDICVWTEQKTGRSELVALKDNVSAQGDFLWGTGTLNGEMVYVFAIKTGKDSFVPKVISISDVIEITQTDEISPNITSYQWELNPAHKDWFFFEKESGSSGYTGEKYRIIVPVGTIDLNYSIDLE
jgi:hypothetical protein